MRISRRQYGYEWSRPVPGITVETEPVRTGYSSLECRVLFNPVETKLISAALWLYGYVWAEKVVDPILLLGCRWFGRHSRACLGRGLRCHHPEDRDRRHGESRTA